VWNKLEQVSFTTAQSEADECDDIWYSSHSSASDILLSLPTGYPYQEKKVPQFAPPFIIQLQGVSSSSYFYLSIYLNRWAEEVSLFGKSQISRSTFFPFSHPRERYPAG
jgi:hypothetical protein